MQVFKMKWIIVLTLTAAVGTGCISQAKYDDLKAQNRIQQERLSELESENAACDLELNQMRKQNQSLRGMSSAGSQAQSATIDALKEDIEKKKALIAQMQAQLLRSGAALPMELSVKFQDFAKEYDMVTFDEKTGMLKFESDLLFDLGSADVSSSAKNSLEALADIINSKEAQEFDLIVAGHTDDVPIRKPSTLAKHPTNWHLSAHRAISVLDVLKSYGADYDRMSVRGFGQYRPAEANQQGKKGNKENRRVEIYLVPKGV